MVLETFLSFPIPQIRNPSNSNIHSMISLQAQYHKSHSSMTVFNSQIFIHIVSTSCSNPCPLIVNAASMQWYNTSFSILLGIHPFFSHPYTPFLRRHHSMHALNQSINQPAETEISAHMLSSPGPVIQQSKIKYPSLYQSSESAH